MDILPVDLTAVIATIMGISIVLIPVAGLTLRFAIKPFVEAIAQNFERQGLEDTVTIVERRLSLLESRIESMEGTMHRLAEAVEFQNELRSGTPPRVLPTGDAGEVER